MGRATLPYRCAVMGLGMKAVDIEIVEGRTGRMVAFVLRTGSQSVPLHATEHHLTSSYPVAYHSTGSDSSLIALDRRTADELLIRLQTR